MWKEAVLTSGNNLTVNGREISTDGAEDTPLLYFLRGRCGLKAAKYGCGKEQCGACKVLVDGRAVHSCTTPVGTVVGSKVVTLEGLGSPENPHALQQAFLEENAGQCGYCLSGILISAAALLESNPDPSTVEIVSALDGNLCRCASYPRYVRAVARAAKRVAQQGAAEGRRP